MRRNKKLIFLSIVGVIVTTGLPILAAITLAHREAMADEHAHLSALARSALAGVDATTNQLRTGGAIVNRLSRQEACSDKGLTLMREIDLGSPLLQAVGYAEGRKMVCSSFAGRRMFDLGPAEMTTVLHAELRRNISLIDPNATYFTSTRGHFVGIVHKDLPLFSVSSEPGLRLGVFLWSNRQPLFNRGNVDHRLITADLADGSVFQSGDDIVAIAKSRQYDLGAIAVLPLSHVADHLRQTVLVLVPIGIFTGWLFSVGLIVVIRQRISMATMIRNGIKENEFFLLYQLVTNLSTGKVEGAEALIRWRHNSGHMVAPDNFIPAAEQADLMPMLTRHVLRLLARDVQGIPESYPDCHFAINFSAADIHRPDAIADLHNFVRQSGLGFDRIVIEATEHSFIDVNEANKNIAEMRQAGAKVAIDDFGIGYSSLAYLAQLDVDYLKIDKLFISALGTASATSRVASQIIQMAKSLDLKTVAEGVETEEQEKILRDLGVDLVQGYRYGVPMPIDDLIRYLRHEESRLQPGPLSPAR
ncbi:MAG TPA: EAL domain-containing protein [Novosphingobium sp.]|nr:EAL domain-containing protein [Novosphingobium sp.]